MSKDNWEFNPLEYGFEETDEPDIFRCVLNRYKDTGELFDLYKINYNLDGSWIISYQRCLIPAKEWSFECSEFEKAIDKELYQRTILYWGNIPTKEFADQLFENTGIGEQIKELKNK